jgi:phosphate transport system substrate-binding protein
VVTIDLNENGRIDRDEAIYNTPEDIINYAEETNAQQLLIENVNVIVEKSFNNVAVKDFLSWIIGNCQQYNKQTGFLKLQNTQVQGQQVMLASAINEGTLDNLYGKHN